MSLGAPGQGVRGIGEHGSKAAKPDRDFPGAGGSVCVLPGVDEREETGGEDLGDDAHARKFGFVDQQQRKSGTDFAVRDEGAAGYVCEEDLCDGRPEGEKGAAVVGAERERSHGAAGGNAIEAFAGAGRFESRKSRRKSGRSGQDNRGSGQSGGTNATAAEASRCADTIGGRTGSHERGSRRERSGAGECKGGSDEIASGEAGIRPASASWMRNAGSCKYSKY